MKSTCKFLYPKLIEYDFSAMVGVIVYVSPSSQSPMEIFPDVINSSFAVPNDATVYFLFSEYVAVFIDPSVPVMVYVNVVAVDECVTSAEIVYP